jgi:glyoxylase-like metal-dependent hydrolase (beta-lactamase superfamily II)
MTYYIIDMMKYETLIVGEMGTNCYLVWTEDKTVVIIDPGDEGTEIAQRINELGLKPKAILLTHGHFDHVMGALDLKLIFNIPVYGHSEDRFLLERQKETANYFTKQKNRVPNFKKIDVDLKNIKNVGIGEERLKVIPLPGHTPGGVGFYYQKGGWLFDGDILFSEGQGKTTHQYSTKTEMEKSIKKILNLPKGTLVLPGHGSSFII